MEVNGHLHAPAALPPRKDISVPIELEAGWPQSRAGPCWTMWSKEKSHMPGIEHGLTSPRTVARLSYRTAYSKRTEKCLLSWFNDAISDGHVLATVYKFSGRVETFVWKSEIFFYFFLLLVGWD
jgi:hypothetical protein